MRPLNTKQAKFAAVYAGNGTAAARLAGYAGNDNVLAQAARGLLRNPQIAQAIRERTAKATAPHIASRQDRQAFWTQIMSDVEEPMPNRLKASELLGKSEADFTDKVEHSGSVTLEQLLLAPEDAA